QVEIFVFTPRGDVKRIPKGATPLDFAFAVHTEVGQRCQGARINGRIAPLHRPLKNGDTVEVMTSPQAKPSRDWLAHVQTARARYPVLPVDDLQAPRPTAFGRVMQRLRLGRGIKIQGVDGLMVRYAQCCQPVPGDTVVGYVTQGRGISIHRSDCPNLLVLSTE